MHSPTNESVDFNQLLDAYAGKEIPHDMHAWFVIAERAREIQYKKRENEERIQRTQRILKESLLQKQEILSIERELLLAMNKVLPQGGLNHGGIQNTEV